MLPLTALGTPQPFQAAVQPKAALALIVAAGFPKLV
jgi:hypothetical protein